MDKEMYMLPPPKSHCDGESSVGLSATSNVSNRSQTGLWYRRFAHVNEFELINVHKHAEDVPKLVPIENV